MLPEINAETRVCISISARPGGFGNRFHNFLYRELGLNFLYKGFACQDAEGAIRGMRALGIRGCGVSMPFKEAVLPLLDEVDPAARAIGAINTIVRDDATGKLKGYNTDYLAMRDLLPDGFRPEGTTALLGSGGMAKAVAHALAELRFTRVTVISRNERAGRELAAKYGFRWAAAPGETVDQLINATPVGMTPDTSSLPAPADWVAEAAAVCDVIANPRETRLIRLAREGGKRVLTGTEITIAQGREQFRLYTGVTPTAGQVERAAQFAFPA